MTEVLAFGAAYVAGVRPMRLLLLGLVLVAPVVPAGLVIAAMIHSKRALDDRATVFCDGVASELRAGATLRSALLQAARSARVHVRFPGSDDDFPSVQAVAAAAAKDLPAISNELEALVQASARSGAAAADLFDELAAISIAHNEIAREIRVASAPARASAWFFVLAPGCFMAIRFANGGFDGLLAVPGQRIAALVGTLLFFAGLVSVLLLLWRAT